MEYIDIFTITSISLVYEMSQKFGMLAENIDNKYELIAKNMEEVKRKSEFQELYNAYAAISNPEVKKYAMQQIEKMKNALKQEEVDISTFSTPDHVANLYDLTKSCLIATNVGDINFFLNHGKYKKKNHLMYESGIPVIRFFIFNKEGGENFEDFKKHVFKVHEELNTVCSIVIDPNDPINKISVIEKMRDILIIDGKILSETKMLHNGKHTDEASITCDESKIREAYKYFSILYNSINKQNGNNEIYFMNDKDIRNKYGKYIKDNDIKANKELAKAILENAIYEK